MYCNSSRGKLQASKHPAVRTEHYQSQKMQWNTQNLTGIVMQNQHSLTAWKHTDPEHFKSFSFPVQKIHKPIIKVLWLTLLGELSIIAGDPRPPLEYIINQINTQLTG